MHLGSTQSIVNFLLLNKSSFNTSYSTIKNREHDCDDRSKTKRMVVDDEHCCYSSFCLRQVYGDSLHRTCHS